VRRSLRLARLALAAGALALATGVPVAAAQEPEPRESDLPATHLEADERDDGANNASAWMAGSGIAAVLLVGIGGTVLARRQRRADADSAPTV
jgi:hypothetical protein